MKPLRHMRKQAVEGGFCWRTSVVTTLVSLAACVALVAGPGTMYAAGTDAIATNKAPSAADTAIRRAATQNQYTFLLFAKEANEAKTNMLQVAKDVVKASAGRANIVEVAMEDDANADVVERFGVRRAPLPLLLVLAPNGAVTGGFPVNCEVKALEDALAGPKEAVCLKNLQEGKVVVVCVQNAANKGAEGVLKTVTAFKEDQRISGFAESVVIDPADQAEKGFLGKLKVDLKSDAATTLLVTPPGRIVGTYTNEITKDAMFADLTRSMAGSTCGGGGCGSAAGGCR